MRLGCLLCPTSSQKAFGLRKLNANMKLGVWGKLEREIMPHDKGYNMFAVTSIGISLRGILAIKSKFLEMGM